jgi:hypothetical protein
VVLIAFLSCCARNPGLDEERVTTQQRVDQLRLYNQQWHTAIEEQKDRDKLKAWALTQGMIVDPPHVLSDPVQLSQALPPPAEGASPLDALQPTPAPGARAPADALAGAPVGSSQD